MAVSERLIEISLEHYIPLRVALEITSDCNLKCCHCYAASTTNDMLDLEEIERLLDELAAQGCIYLVVTGGEPLAHPDAFEILKRARDKHFAIELKTNGTLITPQAARDIKSLNLLNVDVSVYGATPEIHDSITGVAGSFDKSMEAIRLLLEEDIRVTIKTPLMRQNICEHQAIHSLAQSLGVVNMFDTVITARNNGSVDTYKYRLEDADLRGFIEHHFGEYSSRASDKIPDAPLDCSIGCLAGQTVGFVSASGDVYPCLQLPLKLGNIAEAEFGHIWHNSEALNDFRRLRLSDLTTCRSCELLKFCNRCPGMALLENGSLEGVSPEDCRQARIFYEAVQEKSTQ